MVSSYHSSYHSGVKTNGNPVNIMTTIAQVEEFEALWSACAAVFDGGRVACANDAAGGDAIADGVGQLAAASGDRGGSCIVKLCDRCAGSSVHLLMGGRTAALLHAHTLLCR